MLYVANQKGPFKIITPHDPDNVVPFRIIYRPPLWETNTVYQFIDSDEYSVVLPTEFKGYYHAAINSGVSGDTEPAWKLGKDLITNDFETGATAGLQWKAVPFVMVPDISSISITATGGVTLSNKSNTVYDARFTIDEIASDAEARVNGSFTVRARASMVNGSRYDATFQFTLAEH